MTNEMKLLQELCKALGFEVETILDRDERPETKGRAIDLKRGIGFPDKNRTLKSHFGSLDVDERGMYTSYLIEPIISYKLTRIEQEKYNE